MKNEKRHFQKPPCKFVMHFVDEFLATKPAKKCSGFFVRVVSFSRCFVRSFFFDRWIDRSSVSYKFAECSLYFF